MDVVGGLGFKDYQGSQFKDDIFLFQTEDGIRDSPVTGVQTCALPISTQKL